jgi:hypothetical protein
MNRYKVYGKYKYGRSWEYEMGKFDAETAREAMQKANAVYANDKNPWIAKRAVLIKTLATQEARA